MLNKYLTTSEAAHTLDVSRITIFNWIKAGKLNMVRAGKNYLVLSTDIKRIKEEGVVSEWQKLSMRSFAEKILKDFEQVLRRL